MRKILIVLAILLIIILGCKKEVVVEENNDIVDNSVDIQQVKEIKVRAFQFDFDPNKINVNKGDKVKLILTTDDVSHGFYIAEYEINAAIHPGKETVVEFTADKEGSFNFRCSIPCGSGHGAMTGLLVVS